MGNRNGERVARGAAYVVQILGALLLCIAAFLGAKTAAEYVSADQVSVEIRNSYVSTAVLRPQDEPAEEEEPVAPVTVDWDGLLAENADVVAWLEIPSLGISEPVLQGSSNEEYLRMNIRREYSIAGQVFLDELNTAPGLVDNHSLVYGHSMTNGTMFKPVNRISSVEDLSAVGDVWYLTPEKCWLLQPVFYWHAYPERTDVRTFQFATAGELRSWLEKHLDIAAYAVPDAAERIASTAHAMSFITCKDLGRADLDRAVLVCVSADAR